MFTYLIFFVKIFVARLSYDTTDDVLRDAFNQFGDVDDVKIIMDKETGRSKGYGFVEMPNDEEAVQAIATLNESEIDGRSIVVKQSTPQGRDNRGGGRDRRGGGGYRSRDDRDRQGGYRPRRY